jgi:hypothetical protein
VTFFYLAPLATSSLVRASNVEFNLITYSINLANNPPISDNNMGQHIPPYHLHPYPG